MSTVKLHIILISIVCLTLATSCGTSRSTATVYKTTPVGGTSTGHDNKHLDIPPTLHPKSNALLTDARQWLGTPYRYGGEDKRGVDCSGLVLNVYRSALGIKLPRNSAAQADFCSPLSKGQLLPGDLIFFATSKGNKKISHVGIYVGDGKMIHSSTSKGVIVSNISDDYYMRTYACAGCVEQYRAMLDKTSTSPINQPSSVSTTTAYENTGFTLTPVESLPGRNKNNRSSVSPKETSTKSLPTAIKQVSNGMLQPEPNTEEARKNVLDKLIEQKLDSILNRK